MNKKKTHKTSNKNLNQSNSSDDSSTNHRQNKQDKKSKKLKSKPTPSNQNGLNQSKLRYEKLTEKAMQEMSQYTSDDQASVKLKKREHLIKSLKKEYPKHSNRLESMLKNAALNCNTTSDSESIQMTPTQINQAIPKQASN